MKSNPRLAVILFQLGGPDSLENVQPFLYNLFRDPDIINFPGAFLTRKLLAQFISIRRTKIVIENYRVIGGKSPILNLTQAQAASLERELNELIPVKVFVAMRYWHPLTEEVIQKIRESEFQKVVLLPLYPHYSKATTGSSLNEWNRQCAMHNYSAQSTVTIKSFHDHTLYIDAIVQKINQSLNLFSNKKPEDIDLVFSAHGTPLNLVKKGDPYKGQIEETVRLVIERGRWKSPHSICYQSKVGFVKWLEPSLKDTIHELAVNGRKHILIVPISFVTDHLETLHEINIEMRNEAMKLGIQTFEVMPALNDHPKFIQCLKDLVLSKCNDVE